MPTTRSNTNAQQASSTSQEEKVSHEGEEGKQAIAAEISASQLQSCTEAMFIRPDLKITNVTGDLTIDPPDNSFVIHSVNCLGVWGSGVALALAKALPGAYRKYQGLCEVHENAPDTLLGQAQMIPPQKGDYDRGPGINGSAPRPRRWVWCLFVSVGYGRPTKTKPGKSKPADIIIHTRKALKEVQDVMFTGQIGNMADWGAMR